MAASYFEKEDVEFASLESLGSELKLDASKDLQENLRKGLVVQANFSFARKSLESVEY